MNLHDARPARSIFSQATNALLNWVFPTTCAACGRSGGSLCAECAQQARPVGEIICTCCGRVQERRTDFCPLCRAQTDNPLLMVRAATIHAPPILQCIHALKYDNRPELAGPLARYLVAAFHLDDWKSVAPQIDMVIPVPIHAERRAERGYNQAELLADFFCRQVGLSLRPELIERTRHTRQQVGLNARERGENVENAFRAAPVVSGRTLLLVDDVYTTGSTLRACADAASVQGARAIYAIALALPDFHPHIHPHADTAPILQ